MVEYIVSPGAEMGKTVPGKTAITGFKNLSRTGAKQDTVGILWIVGQRANVASVGPDHMWRRTMGIADEKGDYAGRCQGQPPSFAQH